MKIFRLFLWFCFGVLLSAVPLLAFAATTYTVPVVGVTSTPSGLVHTSRLGVSSPLYPALSTTSPLSVPVGPGKQLMVIPTSIAANVPRVAGAVVGLARLSGPIGLGITLLPILCEETGICSSSADPGNYEIPGSAAGATTAPPGYKWYGYDSCTTVCEVDASNPGWDGAGGATCVNPVVSGLQCIYTVRTVTTGTNYDRNVTATRFCPAGYTLSNDVCVSDAQPARTPTEEDWGSAITKLTAAIGRMAAIVDGLQGLGQSVPIDKPILSPTSTISSPTSTINRDPQGNVINTTTTTITTNISPITNNTTNNSVSVTQITNTTVTDSTGAVASTTEKSEDPAPDDEMTIEFDTVADTDLEKQEIPLTLDPVSWGEGSCPADPVVSVMGASISIPVHVACDYMSTVRPIVLAFFALISAYIIIGVRQEA